MGPLIFGVEAHKPEGTNTPGPKALAPATSDPTETDFKNCRRSIILPTMVLFFEIFLIV
jgi:hypothetical protein